MNKQNSGYGSLLMDLGPIIAFFAAYRLSHENIYVATVVIMVATGLAVGWTWLQTRKFRMMPVITLVLVTVFGGLTIWLHNPVFIKMKPTIIYVLFACALGIGALTGNLYIRSLFGGAFEMEDSKWTILTWRWVGFFLALAAFNEWLWRNVSESTWVNVKTFGFMPLMILFMVAHLPFFLKYGKEPVEDGQAEAD